MKKFALILLVAVLCVPIFAFAACADPSDDPYDLSTKEIGYEIPVYPDCEFSYKIIKTEYNYETMQDEVVLEAEVHISEFSVTLVNKNPVSAGDILDEDYGYYTVKLHVEGLADSVLVGKTLWFQTIDAQGKSTVDSDGSIIWDFEHSFTGNDEYYILKAIIIG